MVTQPSKPFNTSVFLSAVLSATTPMASLLTHKSSLKPSRPSNSSSPSTTNNASPPPPPPPVTPPLRSTPSSQPSHFAMIELKQKILASISKLSDRDTHHIAVEDLEKIIQTLSSDSIPMLLNCLCDASGDPKPLVKKESLRLIGFLCTSHTDSTSTHLNKIISTIVRRLKDTDSGVRDACRDTIGVLAAQYLRGGDGENANLGPVMALFVKPLFEAMSEQSKTVQAGAAVCMAKMVESAADPPVVSFQKLCPRICKLLNNQNFLAKAALLPVVASLSQVGAIAPQSLPVLLQSIHESLESTDWGTRKAAADALGALASHSSYLIEGNTSSTLTALEACRFDKIKPVRDSMNEALQLWKKIAEKGGDEASDSQNTVTHDEKSSQLMESVERMDTKKTNPGEKSMDLKDTSSTSSPKSDSLSKAKGSSISDKTVVILKKKAPALTEKVLNPEFFQKLETRVSGDLPVEVVVPRRYVDSSNSQVEEEPGPNESDYRERASEKGNVDLDDVRGSASINYVERKREADDFAGDRTVQRVSRENDLKPKAFDGERIEKSNQADSTTARTGFSRTDGHAEGSFMDNKGNWLAIQRQLLQMERQQAHLMNMLEDFMGGSHDSMITLENRVRGLESVVEEMARDLALSSGRRGSNFMVGVEGSSNRSLGKYSLSDYSSTKLARGGDGRLPLVERFLPSDSILLGSRGRDAHWRSDAAETWDSFAHGTSRNGHVGARRGLGGIPSDGRSPRPENDDDQIGNRRGWVKGAGVVRLGEGPSARSVWRASKDEATLEAIRVAGEDNGTSSVATRRAIPELDRELLDEDGAGQEQRSIWASWSNAMDALHVGDIDTAYAEVLSTGDYVLLVKLMDRSGPVVDQLSVETASDVLQTIGQILQSPEYFDIGLSWIQQLAELVTESGPDVLDIPVEIKRDLLLDLQEASAAIDPPEDWEGAMPDQLVLHLASVWKIDLSTH